MTKLGRHVAGSIALALISVSTPVCASTVIESYNFTANTSGPITSHSGSFSFSYDEATPSALTLVNIDFKLGDYDFDVGNTQIVRDGNGFDLGGAECGIYCIIESTNDFYLFNSPTASRFGYTASGFHGFAFDDTAIVTASVSAVPALSTWAMILIGTFASGLVLRSRRQHRGIMTPATA